MLEKKQRVEPPPNIPNDVFHGSKACAIVMDHLWKTRAELQVESTVEPMG